MNDILEKPDIDTFEEIDFDQELKCDAESCDNAAAWLRRHEKCLRLCCDECRDQIMSQVHDFLDDDTNFYCARCGTSQPATYWAISLRWFPV